jgi:hypothetical protein
MYWENELRCPHCKAVQVDHDGHPRDEWRQTHCEACEKPFKFLVVSVPQYSTMSPELEAVRQQQRDELRALLEKA